MELTRLKEKVLFLLHFPPPIHGSAVVGKFIKDSLVINELKDTHYINLSTSSSIDEIGKKPLKKIFVYFKILVGVLSQVIKNKFEVIYIAPTVRGIGFYKDIFIVFFAKFSTGRIVLHLHNKGVSKNQDRLLDHTLYKIFFKNVKVMLLSPALYKDISKYVKEADVFYCPNGIPEFERFLDVPKAVNGKVEVIFLSNLIESKGVNILLEACSILLRRGVSFHCTFIGGEGDIDSMKFEETVRHFGVQNVIEYKGKRFGKEKEEALKNSDIFVLPSFNDCFPLVLLEAMQCSLPIVSTFEGGIPGIVDDGITGFLVQQKNAEQLANKLEILIHNQALREQMGRAGREKFLREYTLEKFENRMVEILNAVADNKH
jgi:glycosyltransferase involved in cell wall biosynthesis